MAMVLDASTPTIRVIGIVNQMRYCWQCYNMDFFYSQKGKIRYAYSNVRIVLFDSTDDCIHNVVASSTFGSIHIDMHKQTPIPLADKRIDETQPIDLFIIVELFHTLKKCTNPWKELYGHTMDDEWALIDSGRKLQNHVLTRTAMFVHVGNDIDGACVIAVHEGIDALGAPFEHSTDEGRDPCVVDHRVALQGEFTQIGIRFQRCGELGSIFAIQPIEGQIQFVDVGVGGEEVCDDRCTM